LPVLRGIVLSSFAFCSSTSMVFLYIELRGPVTLTG
jgi:hypothetical protein